MAVLLAVGLVVLLRPDLSDPAV